MEFVLVCCVFICDGYCDVVGVLVLERERLVECWWVVFGDDVGVGEVGVWVE